MVYNVEIDGRIRKIVSRWKHTENKKMFGGVCHLINGNMFCGVHKDFLILRLGEAGAAEAMARPFVKPFDITGRPMKGWVMVGEEGFMDEEELRSYLRKAKQFASSLPSK